MTDHYLGIYRINNRLYLIDDLYPRSYKTQLPVQKVFSAFFLRKD